jgi:flagellar motor protein MotB
MHQAFGVQAQFRADAQKMIVIDEVQDLIGETEQDAIELATALAKEISAGVLEVETKGRDIIVRVKEHGSFPSGSDSLSENFKPVLRIIQDVRTETEGQIFEDTVCSNCQPAFLEAALRLQAPVTGSFVR